MKSFSSLRPLVGLFASTPKFAGVHQARWAHHLKKNARAIPQPQPFVPDVPTFLNLIGRGMNKYAAKFPTWDSLFSSGATELQELGIEPARKRRYLLNWMKRFTRKDFGPGGDLQFVKDGKALLKIATPPAGSASLSKWVVNVPFSDADVETPPTKLVRPAGYKVVGMDMISGPYVETLPNGAGAVVTAKEGMWEIRQGVKIDGGERRRAEVRFKKRAAERRAQLEQELMSHL